MSAKLPAGSKPESEKSLYQIVGPVILKKEKKAQQYFGNSSRVYRRLAH